MKVVAGGLAVMVAATVFGLSRGSISGHDIAHDPLSLVAYVVAVVAAQVAAFGWVRRDRS